MFTEGNKEQAWWFAVLDSVQGRLFGKRFEQQT